MRHTLATVGLTLVLGALPCLLYAAETATAAARTGERTLDLRAPEIGRIFSPEQINAVLSQVVERIEVAATRLDGLPFEDRSDSPVEAAAKTVSWLITPSPTFATRMNNTPDPTYSHRPEPFLQANYHASFAER
jgi:hypothetical protein